MRAILIATGYQLGMEPLVKLRPTPLMQVAGKPIIVHIIEFLSRHGVKKFEIILHNLPELIERKLEDGKRWGIQITYHLARRYEYPFASILPCMDEWKQELIILGQGDSLPGIEPKIFTERHSGPTFLMYSAKKWSGWGFFPKDLIETFSPNMREKDLPSEIKGHSKCIIVKNFISTRSLIDLKKSNQIAINSKSTHNLHHTNARMVEPNVWISRSVIIHPNAKVLPPIFIGESTQIKAGSTIGPNSIIERNCIIDNNSTVQNSLVCSRSYIGEGLDIQNSIIDRNILINLSLNTVLKIRDDFILSELTVPTFKNYPLMLLERFAALILCILLSPLFLLLLFKQFVKKERKLVLPADAEDGMWTEFDFLSFEKRGHAAKNKFEIFFTHLPTLWNVFKGEMHFVGVNPITIDQAKTLPLEWKNLYLKSQAGLITLVNLDYGSSATKDEYYAAETYYAVHKNGWFNFKLFLRWIEKKVIQFFHVKKPPSKDKENE